MAKKKKAVQKKVKKDLSKVRKKEWNVKLKIKSPKPLSANQVEETIKSSLIHHFDEGHIEAK